MNIYKLSRSNYKHDYDTYESAIVVAHNEMKARETLPFNKGECRGYGEYDGWVNYKDVIVTFIGTTNLYPGLLLSSFNAG